MKRYTIEKQDQLLAYKNGGMYVVPGNLCIMRDLRVDGFLIVKGNLRVLHNKNLYVNGDVRVSKNTDIHGDITINGNISGGGRMTVNGDVDIKGFIDVGADVTIFGELTTRSIMTPGKITVKEGVWEDRVQVHQIPVRVMGGE